MAIIKCKMCGGDLALIEDQFVAECEYCGSRQTVPTADNEKKLTLFARANRLRAACEFDKAAGIYESIVADFPEEAETYWGLVLCKYGIEYVDDPATGKKIPTCHRSSFDSVMDDSNFEQAMENADAIARKVYREEAKQIEEIRKGIIEVSSNEEPYDIFICYKETDENGDRTLDSVLAQDIYDALTDKDYRTFFARITLEDKLGQEYEPYIFAALNSAKIMLAVGTDYEYYDAVWVKNEWSRFLKLMEKDKSKHLIPCYKGIDAYDMPKEFARLQAQDLGKMGAIQDILRGVEKLLPKKQNNTTVIQERVVVGGAGGNNKIASLLDRGNMALEDGDWAKADSFFEDVLNNDSKNAQAYIGKTLAQERCRTIDAFIRKRKDASQNVRGQTLKLEANHTHVAEMVQKCSLPGYVEQYDIRNLYTYDLSYHSDAAERGQQYQNEENYWEKHKQLSRAEKFAVGAVAETLQKEKKHLFAQLGERVKSAEKAEAAAIAEVEQSYAAHMAQADEKAEKLYNDGLARREKDYQIWLNIAKNDPKVDQLRQAQAFFEKQSDYKDSKTLAEHCRKRIDDITAEQKRKEAEAKAAAEAEAERQRIAKAKADAARKRKNAIIGIVAALMAVMMIAVIMVVTKVIIPENNYKAAVALAEAEQYEEAAEAFEALGNYKDSQAKANAMRENVLVAEKRAEEEQLAAEKRAEEERLAQEYATAESLLAEGKHTDAAIAFAKVGVYKDAWNRSLLLWNKVAHRSTIESGEFYTVGLKTDGTVIAVGDNKYGQCNVSGWTDIIAISAGGWHTVGLKTDGTVTAVGDNKYGQCNVSGWMDIVAISAGDHHTVGLKTDGTVVAAGEKKYGQCDVSGWVDIVAVSAGAYHTVGLKTDGTVIAVGENYDGQCDVSGWTDIVAISAGAHYTVGLKTDGTVIAVGGNYDGQCDVSGWTDIVAISAGYWHTVGLKADGTVIAVGTNGNTNRCDVFGWSDITSISAQFYHTVGLKEDGTVVTTEVNGKYNYDQCDVDDWTGIKIPN